MATLRPGPGQGGDEAIPSGERDMRSEVTGDLLKPPYVNIVRIEARHPCCGYVNGTAFLIAPGECKTLYFYLTAAHVLYCSKLEDEKHRHKERLADQVQILSAGAKGHEHPIASVKRVISTNGDEGCVFTPADAWYKVNPLYKQNISDTEKRLQYDICVVAIPLEEIKPKFVEAGGFVAFPRSELRVEYPDCRISGFPGVEKQTPPLGGNAELDTSVDTSVMFEHSEKASKVVESCLWTHRIHTSEGQSGSPLYITDSRTSTVLGLHVHGKEDHNVAVVLTTEVIIHATSGFAGPAPSARPERSHSSAPASESFHARVQGIFLNSQGKVKGKTLGVKRITE